MKYKILIDLDHTLFNTQEFRKFLDKDLSKINFKDFLYKDALPFIEYVKKYGLPTLFTEGEANFQNTKIGNLGLRKVFGRNIKVFSSNEKACALENYKKWGGAILIDDKPEVLDEAISLGYKTIRVRRGKYKLRTGKMKPDYIVSDLETIIKKDLFKKLLNV